MAHVLVESAVRTTTLAALQFARLVAFEPKPRIGLIILEFKVAFCPTIAGRKKASVNKHAKLVVRSRSSITFRSLFLI
jgi:hypothetical protein